MRARAPKTQRIFCILHYFVGGLEIILSCRPSNHSLMLYLHLDLNMLKTIKELLRTRPENCPVVLIEPRQMHLRCKGTFSLREQQDPGMAGRRDGSWPPASCPEITVFTNGYRTTGPQKGCVCVLNKSQSVFTSEVCRCCSCNWVSGSQPPRWEASVGVMGNTAGPLQKAPQSQPTLPEIKDRPRLLSDKPLGPILSSFL